jgi:phage-Barnase-EndoU-ColicinE5/D-RelE like nuclease3
MAAHKKQKPSSIAKLIEFSREDTTNTYQEINFGHIPNFKAQEIIQLTGVRVNGAKKILNTHAVTHTLSSHGDDKKETERGQKGVTNEDFELIPVILNDYNTVLYGGLNSKKKESLVFVKEINNLTYYVVMAVSINKEETNLFMNTMYIKRGKTKK